MCSAWDGGAMNKVPQPMNPHGFVGRLLGWSMDLLNRRAMDDALALLQLTAEDRYLEVGFGTGALLRRAARIVGDPNVAGVDPSRLMVETARRRVSGDIRLGSASSLPWPDRSFTAAAAVHCFQFFADPLGDLREIRRVLTPRARFALVLRRHRRDRAASLPNHLVRHGDEAGNAVRALEAAGFSITRPPRPGQRSPVILAVVDDQSTLSSRTG